MPLLLSTFLIVLFTPFFALAQTDIVAYRFGDGFGAIESTISSDFFESEALYGNKDNFEIIINEDHVYTNLAEDLVRSIGGNVVDSEEYDSSYCSACPNCIACRGSELVDLPSMVVSIPTDDIGAYFSSHLPNELPWDDVMALKETCETYYKARLRCTLLPPNCTTEVECIRSCTDQDAVYQVRLFSPQFETTDLLNVDQIDIHQLVNGNPTMSYNVVTGNLELTGFGQ